MKNAITFLMCSLCIITAIAQSDFNGDQLVIPERTPALEALYQQSKTLEENGTAAEINANRLAIKTAWQAIDPKVAALYKPVETINYPMIGGDGTYRPAIVPDRQLENRAPEDWATDKLLRTGFIDGLDMDVTGDGDIYIAAFENFTNGGSDSSIYIYRSTDGGDTFSLWKDQPVVGSLFSKIQVITIDGTGDEYLLVFAAFQNEVFQVIRWNMATGVMGFQGVASDVVDFGVDANYSATTSNQRALVTYNKSTNSTFSARSTAGSYGFDWVDEFSFGTVGEQVEMAYGINGGCYATYIGFNSKNLYAKANDDYNDPASWSLNETVVAGSSKESLNPTIRAARKTFGTDDEVLILASTRNAGSTDSYIGQAYRRENGAAYAPLNYVITSAGYNIAHIDTWMGTTGPADVIETSYVRDRIDNSQDDVNRSNQYDGSVFSGLEGVGDTGRDVFDGFPSAIAETSDGFPCMAFAGTSGSFGFGLYFDAKNGVTVGIADNNFEGFKFYPNPAQDVLNLSANSTIESVSIFSILGQKVMENSINQNDATINIANLSQGVYILKLVINGQSATYKFVKQ
ncbi:hypothetical protein Aeqsu_0989 [Aequorivita sublithincola DSM 14238]|uniref:Secretion system C-terminal sorting domain-containing protein n=1 Tax=Aequorivita sublithincola (strain DSM 14238 / LMG 21431 / ACAM 643 / 9-3) TaxID=746697 RepID=I3YU22_AEQSU|nr:T9SS type A sorting domain-containing protein [Aequorivita sublithincola]AFL80490.1 hypothetical protein Aeqsu_0989 [Aequorivita sublithincola DSM 14238]